MITVNENIRLNQATVKDAGDIFRGIDQNRDSLRTWLPFVDYTKEEKDTLAFLESTKQTGEQVFVIRYKNDFAGLLGLKAIDMANKKAEIGYWLLPSCEKKGIMTCCCWKILEYAFTELELNRLLIQVAIGNERSRKVPARLGFKEEGIERDGELLESGYTDIIRYGLLKKEYNENL